MAFGSKNSTPSFVLTLPFDISLNEQDYLYKEFKKCGVIYNQLVSATTKMWHQLRKTRKYRELMAAIAKAAPDSKEQKVLLKQRQEMIKSSGFSEGTFHKMVEPYAKHFAIHSHVAQKVASAVWTAWEGFFFRKGKAVHYKKLEDVTSISGKNNATGIVLRPANLTTSNIRSAKNKKQKAIEQRYYKAYGQPDPEDDKKVILPDVVIPQMEADIVAAVAKVKLSIGEGSLRIVYGDHVLRAFLYWKGNDGPDLWNGIDLDLSVVFYGEEKAKFVYYANPKDETLGAIHSGDRRCSGKNGAVEYVDFDIKKCFQNGFRYAALTVKSYSGEKFSEMENAFCGVMVRDGKTGEQFEPATVKDRFALTTDSDQLVMVVIDLMTREVITVDKSVAQFRLACRNVVTDYAPTVAACTYAMQLKSLSIKEMLGMRYAQFLKSDDWKHASVIVSDEPEKFKVTDKDTPAPRIVSPYDIPGIYDLIFGKENQ